jgi:hypothetical protein
VAIAILLITVTAFTALFNFAYGGIFTQGRKSEALFDQVQNDLEELYSNGTVQNNDTLVIDFGGSPAAISVVGIIVEQAYHYDGNQGSIYTFIPKK